MISCTVVVIDDGDNWIPLLLCIAATFDVVVVAVAAVSLVNSLFRIPFSDVPSVGATDEEALRTGMLVIPAPIPPPPPFFPPPPPLLLVPPPP